MSSLKKLFYYYFSLLLSYIPTMHGTTNYLVIKTDVYVINNM